MQHSTTTAAPIQSNNKKQKVEQAAVQAAEPVQSSSIDDIQLSATPLTNERLISMLSSKLINTANNYGDRFTVLELEQVSIEEIGYQSRFNSDESDVVNRLLSKYMPNNESSPNNRPRTEKSTNIKTTDNGWIHESKIYYNKNDRNQKVRIIRATNGRYSALLFCPNQYLFPSLYNKHAREMIINAAPENVMEVLVSSFRSRITSLPNSDSITGTFNELISYYNDVNGEQKAKPNKTTVAKSEIPRSMSCKSKDRYDRDNEEVRTNKSNTSVSSRLEMVATGQYRPDDEELINVIVNTKYRDNNRLIESGIPFGFINDTYKCMLIDKEEYADLPDKIILDNKEEPLSDYTVGKMKYNNNIGPRIIVNKNGYAYLYVDDHFNLERLDIVSDTCDKIGAWNMIPVMLQILCANEVFRQCNNKDIHAEGSTDTKPSLSANTEPSISGGTGKSGWYYEKSSKEGLGLCEFVQQFIVLCFTSLVLGLDFYSMDINVVLDRFPWFLWNFLSFEFYDYLDKNMQRRMDLMKDLLKSRVKSLLPPDIDESSDEFNQLYESIRKKCRDFHYLIIMAISHSSTDLNTRRCYEQLMFGKLDGLSLLEDIGRVKDFIMYFEGLIEIMRSYSLYTQRALLIITLAVTSVIDYDGDIPKGNHLLAIEQIKDKKYRIALNTRTLFTHDMKDFVGIGVDTHVKRVLKILIYVYMKKVVQVDISLDQAETCAYIVVDWIDPSIGIYCNEILAQLGQYMESSSDECKDILTAVFDKVGNGHELYNEVIKMWKEDKK